MPIRAVDQGLYPMAKGRAAGLALLDQGRQGRFSHQRKEHLAYYPIWITECSFGNAEQQAGLTFDALQFADHLGGDTLLGPDRDPMDDLDQQIHEPIDDFFAALPAECRQQGISDWRGMAPQLANRLSRGPSAIAG